MSPTLRLVAVAVAWCAIGTVISIWMRRRGHELFMWAYLGVVLGPLVLPLAVQAIARERHVAATPVRRAPANDGRLGVIVGIDGSPESLAAAQSAAALLGDRIGRLTLAAVVDYDRADARSPEGRREADAHLAEAAHAIAFAFGTPERVTLVGLPAAALERAAVESGADLLVVGHRGRGASRALLGSVATRLASGTGVPVLIR
jgi:nucleotide-binding universal stress UspA family protein